MCYYVSMNYLQRGVVGIDNPLSKPIIDWKVVYEVNKFDMSIFEKIDNNEIIDLETLLIARSEGAT